MPEYYVIIAYARHGRWIQAIAARPGKAAQLHAARLERRHRLVNVYNRPVRKGWDKRERGNIGRDLGPVGPAFYIDPDKVPGGGDVDDTGITGWGI